MAEQAPLRTGALLLRVWVENRKADGLRARVFVLEDVRSGEQTMYAAAGVDEIGRRVRTWLEGFLAGETSTTAPPTLDSDDSETK